MKKYYVGLCTTFHDPAIAIMDSDGNILFAEATERYLQHKRGFNCEPDNILYVSKLIKTYCDPQGEFVVGTNWQKHRPYVEIIHTLLGESRAESMQKQKNDRFIRHLFLEKYKMAYQLALLRSGHNKRGVGFVQAMRSEFNNNKISFRHFPHHLTHATMACYGSSFEESCCMIVDSYGGSSSIAYFHYKDGQIKLIKNVYGTQSLGFLYMKLTELCGFSWIKGEEWKVMGLAPYGKLDQEIYDCFDAIIKVDGLNIKSCSTRNINRLMEKLHKKIRGKDEPVLHSANMAYTGQLFFENIMTKLLNNFYALGLSKNLVLAGGCALNSAYNGQILEKTPFSNLYVPSAPGDDGCALGAAMMAYLSENKLRRSKFSSPYLGSSITAKSLGNLLQFGKIPKIRHLPENICKETARLLSEEKLIGWIQGKAEFGPRSLGNRSILADPRSPGMKDKINSLVKFREEYRPFAPSILHEYGDDYFDGYQESPYMERTLRFRKSVYDKVPAVVHENGTGRLQTVKEEWNPKFYSLISEFHKITSVPILLNTSLNIMGKPIVHSVEDAIALFYTTGLDALIIDDYLIEK